MLVLALLYALIINLIAFFVYADDKRRARHDQWRISESTLVVVALVGGSVGALLAMLMLRHKTRHRKYVIGIPAILLVQILIIYVLVL